MALERDSARGVDHWRGTVDCSLRAIGAKGARRAKIFSQRMRRDRSAAVPLNDFIIAAGSGMHLAGFLSFEREHQRCVELDKQALQLLPTVLTRTGSIE